LTKRSILRDVIHGVIHLDQNTFVAECLEVAVVTQGGTLDEVVKNLNDALALHLEGEDLATFGLSSHLRLQLSFELPLSL
jgi:predicted RNase H-like HicB family nuclease